jgi:hypothetical protein
VCRGALHCVGRLGVCGVVVIVGVREVGGCGRLCCLVLR